MVSDAYTTGSMLLGGAAARRFLTKKEVAEAVLPPVIEIVNKGNGKNVLVLMSAGDNKPTTFDQPKLYFRHLNQALDWHEMAVYCAGGCTGCEKPARQITRTQNYNGTFICWHPAQKYTEPPR